MNRYLQKILEITSRLILNQVYKYKYPSISKPITLSNNLNYRPLISIVIPVYKPKISLLKACYNSVLNQSYNNWELILVNDYPGISEIEEFFKQVKTNPKVKTFHNPSNLGIVAATNKGLEYTKGEWIAFLDNDDYLWPDALQSVVEATNQHKDAQFIYSDEDKIDENNRHFDPFLKKNFDINLIRQVNYINHFSLIKKDLLDILNNLRQGTDFAQDWDLILRASNKIKPDQFIHIPKILYSWRAIASSTASKQGISSQQQKISDIQHKVLQFDNPKHSYSQSRYLGIWSTDNQPTVLPYQLHLHSLLQLLSLRA